MLKQNQPDSPGVWPSGSVGYDRQKRLNVKSFLPASVERTQPDDATVGGNK